MAATSEHNQGHDHDHDHDSDHGHGHGHGQGQGHGHGHAADRGLSGAWRYLRLLPRMWRSSVSDAVVALIEPGRGDRLVDIGAGMGPATVAAAKTGAIIVAVEPTPFMRGVLRARRQLQRARQRILVIDGAAESLHIADGTCDGAWAVNSMHHWNDVPSAIAEIHRVLRDGGRVVLVDEIFDDPSHPAFAKYGHRRTAHRHEFDEIDVDSFAELMTAAGFSSATGERGTVAERPAKLVRAVK